MTITEQQKQQLFEYAYLHQKVWEIATQGGDQWSANSAFDKRIAVHSVLDILGLTDEYEQYVLNQSTEGRI